MTLDLIKLPGPGVQLPYGEGGATKELENQAVLNSRANRQNLQTKVQQIDYQDGPQYAYCFQSTECLQGKPLGYQD